jgi:hypothetical protein
VGNVSVTFESHGFTIYAILMHGVVQSELIFAKDHRQLTETEIQTLLNSETSGEVWKAPNENSFGKCWDRGSATATYDFHSNTLSFMTLVYQRAQLAKNTEKASLQNF